MKQLQDLSASHAAYVKHLRIVNSRLDDVLRFTDKIAEEVNEVHSARSVQASVSAMDADTEEFKAACNIVLKEIGKRDPHLMSLVHGVTPLPGL